MKRLAYLPLLVLCALPCRAAISAIDAKAAAGAATITFTVAPQANDLIVACGFRSGSTTAPTASTGYTVIDSPTGANTASMRCEFKVAAGTETTVAMTNANSIGYNILRGVNTGNPIGGHVQSSGTVNPVSYTTLTMTRTDNTSWVLGFSANKTATSMGGAPTGMTVRSDGGASVDMNASDTNGTVSAWATQTVSASTSTTWRAETVEIIADPLTPTCASGSCPKIVQDDDAGMVDNGQSAATWSMWLPDKVPTGNSVLCFYKHDAGTAITTTLSDDQSNAWTAIGELQDAANVPTITIGAKIALNTTGNPQKITIAFSTAEPNIHLHCMDIAFVGAVDVSATGGPGAGPNVATSLMTPTVANDLIAQYAFDDGVSTPASITTTADYNLLGTNSFLANASQFTYDSSTAAVAPKMTANADFWDTLAVALKYDATKGGDFSSGIRIRCLDRYRFQHEGTSTTDSTPAVCPVGTGPNLVVAAFSTDAALLGVTAVSDSDSNTYTAVSAAGCSSSANTQPQIWYAQNATFSSANTRTISFAHNTGSPSNVMLYYIEGAATSAFDTRSCPASATQGHPGDRVCDGLSSNGTTDDQISVSITPSTANGLLIFVENNGFGPECNSVGTGDTSNNDMTWFCTVAGCATGGENDTTSDMEASSGYAHIYNTSAASKTVTWWFANLPATTTGTDTVNMAVAFKAAAGGGGGGSAQPPMQMTMGVGR